MLLVTLHDVTPALADEVRHLWHLCRTRGVTPGLLVVPDWHGVAPIEADAAFLAWLRDAQDAGAELFLHGERHVYLFARRSCETPSVSRRSRTSVPISWRFMVTSAWIG